MRAKLVITAAVLFGAAAAIAIWLTRPQMVDAAALAELTPDPANGALVFAAMGCASCHSAEIDGDSTHLGGGKRFETPFGTFSAPNISQDTATGIGGWSDRQIASAIRYGTDSSGQHLYPALPYASYIRASDQDLVDVTAHLRSLPAVEQVNSPHELPFPFNIRLSLGGWKLLFLNDSLIIDGELNETEARGRYLVEGLAHCGECHTPRNILGGPDRSRWLSGAPNPSGKGTIPDISRDGLDWSDSDIASYLQTGFTPDFDTAGGSMAAVVRNLALLPKEDITAIVAYLRLVP